MYRKGNNPLAPTPHTRVPDAEYFGIVSHEYLPETINKNKKYKRKHKRKIKKGTIMHTYVYIYIYFVYIYNMQATSVHRLTTNKGFAPDIPGCLIVLEVPLVLLLLELLGCPPKVWV